jgi:ATP-dependent DNA helicase RecQ
VVQGRVEGFKVKSVRDQKEILRSVFGHKGYKSPLQEQVITHVIAGGDAVVLFPTGDGKSLCYQLPALVRDGTGIVVSPLIALMRDQTEALKAIGVKAEALHSKLDAKTSADIRARFLAGELDLLYVTPERLALSRRSPCSQSMRVTVSASGGMISGLNI